MRTHREFQRCQHNCLWGLPKSQMLVWSEYFRPFAILFSEFYLIIFPSPSENPVVYSFMKENNNIHSKLGEFTELLLKCKTKKVHFYNQYVKIHGQCITFMASLIKNEIPSFCNTQRFSLSKMKILTAATKSSSWCIYW